MSTSANTGTGSPASIALPLFASVIKAGFPSPADDYIENTLDFNEYLVARPAATFCLRVSGDSMTGAGIHDGDILVVDRSVTPSNGKIIIAVIDGELTVKRLECRSGKVSLCPENSDYKPIEVSPDSNFEIWGVVMHSIHSV